MEHYYVALKMFSSWSQKSPKIQEILLKITTGNSIDVIDTCGVQGTSKYMENRQQTMANQGK